MGSFTPRPLSLLVLLVCVSLSFADTTMPSTTQATEPVVWVELEQAMYSFGALTIRVGPDGRGEWSERPTNRYDSYKNARKEIELSAEQLAAVKKLVEQLPADVKSGAPGPDWPTYRLLIQGKQRLAGIPEDDATKALVDALMRLRNEARER